MSVGAVSTYEFTQIAGDHTIHALFAIDTYTITATAEGNGSIAPQGELIASYGESLVFTITPSANHHIADVLVDGMSVGAVSAYEFTQIAVNHTIHALFAIDTYTITATAEGDGSIAPKVS